MRILLIAPTTRSDAVAACGTGWNRVVDLGIAGQCSYRQWSNQLQCRVDILPKAELGDFQRIRALFFSGFDRMVDDHGLDWWELLSLDFHQNLEQILKLQKWAKEIGPRDDVFVTQPCFEAAILNRLFRRSVRYVTKGNAVWDRVTHYASVASKFSVGELWQILGDKYDAGYRFRSYVAKRRTKSERPVILLPSAYANASRMLMQYATALPELDFLLVATRNSGRIASFPGNVRVSSLASYAGATSVREEYEGLLRCWYDLKIKLRQSKEFALLFDLGALDLFPKLLSVGLEIRNAWISVFADEPISSVLCGDDANPRTRIPVLLSASRGLPTLSCHHGAIDGRYRFRRVHPGILLAKSRMEYDYLVRSCGVSPEKLEIVAPAFDPLAPTAAAANPTSIVFFSEPYEISGGRCKEFYRDLLPPLAELAVRHNCELVIKLHPMESLHERQRFAEAALSKDQLQRSRVISGPLDGELLAQTWFAVTVLSTTAIDCARRHIPCFLCQWLDSSNYDYQKQFLKFGAATVLRSPEDLLTIPSQLETYSWPEKSDLWEANSDKRLERLLQGSQRAKDVLASA